MFAGELFISHRHLIKIMERIIQRWWPDPRGEELPCMMIIQTCSFDTAEVCHGTDALDHCSEVLNVEFQKIYFFLLHRNWNKILMSKVLISDQSSKPSGTAAKSIMASTVSPRSWKQLALQRVRLQELTDLGGNYIDKSHCPAEWWTRIDWCRLLVGGVVWFLKLPWAGPLARGFSLPQHKCSWLWSWLALNADTRRQIEKFVPKCLDCWDRGRKLAGQEPSSILR